MKFGFENLHVQANLPSASPKGSNHIGRDLEGDGMLVVNEEYEFCSKEYRRNRISKRYRMFSNLIRTRI